MSSGIIRLERPLLKFCTVLNGIYWYSKWETLLFATAN